MLHVVVRKELGEVGSAVSVTVLPARDECAEAEVTYIKFRSCVCDINVISFGWLVTPKFYNEWRVILL
jgi:hypothetical protein